MFGCSSEVGPLKSVLLKHVREAFSSPEDVNSQWKSLGYPAPPDLTRALKEYNDFATILQDIVPEVHFLPGHVGTGLDSLYVRDPVVMTTGGAVIGRMGKRARRGEPAAVAATLDEIGIPVLGEITGEGTLEGGDVVIFDSRTLAVGQGYRTNAEGIRQLKMLTGDSVDELVVVPLPHWTGPGDVLHLMSLISPVDRDLAVVYSRLLPVPFREWLLERGLHLIEVPDSEFDSMACNILALAPRKCVMLAGNPETRALMEKKGVEVFEYAGEEISRKGAGGPTCLIRPLGRED